MTNEQVYEAAQALCNSSVDIDKTSKQSWLQSKYFRIEYEEVCYYNRDYFTP